MIPTIPIDDVYCLKVPESSDWECELFGLGPRGLSFRPAKGQVPNFFWRWMQFLLVGNRWVYRPQTANPFR